MSCAFFSMSASRLARFSSDRRRAYVLEASRRWYNAIKNRIARARGSSPVKAARRDWSFTKFVTSWYSSSSAPSMWKSTTCGMRFVKIFFCSYLPSGVRCGKYTIASLVRRR